MAALDQRLPRLGPMALLKTAVAVPRAPRLAASMVPTVARMGPALAHYARYPAEPDERALVRWSHRVARLFKERADIGGDVSLARCARPRTDGGHGHGHGHGHDRIIIRAEHI